MHVLVPRWAAKVVRITPELILLTNRRLSNYGMGLPMLQYAIPVLVIRLGSEPLSEIGPLASNEMYGPRTRRELFSMLREDPWWQGVGKYQRRKTIV